MAKLTTEMTPKPSLDSLRRIPPVGLSKPDAVVAFYDTQIEFTFKAAREIGPMVEMWPGAVLVTGAGEVDAILRSRDEEFVGTRTILDRPVELTTGSQRRAKWQQLRRAASAAMTPSRIDEHMTWVSQRAAELAGEWLARGEVGDLKTSVTPLVRDSIIRFCFGDRELGPQLPKAMADTEEALFRLFVAIIDWPLVIRAFIPREWRARWKVHVLHRTLRAAMQAPGNGGISDVLAGSGLTSEERMVILRSTLLAAQGMPAASLAWALVELGRHPAEQDVMAEALDGHAGPGVPKQVEWVVDETLRLWPSGFLGRRATRDVDCAGWLVPAKTEVAVPLWALHRLSSCFPDPDEFIPGRWATASPRLGEYVPFGGGSHRCFGARLGRAQMCTALAAIISRCRITLTGEVQPADPLSVLRPAGCGLIVSPRERRTPGRTPA